VPKIMSAPRCVLPGTTYLLTRRCSERRFFLRPAPEVNRIISYCLAVATQRFGVLLHACCFLSNHWHLVATDPRGELPLFMHCFDLLVARALNARYGRFEALWAAGTYSAVQLTDADTILDKIAYALANPVMAGLVEAGHLWPGLRSRPGDIGGRSLVIRRPPHFFRRDPARSLPVEVTLVLTPPPAFEDLPLATVQARVDERVTAREHAARNRRRSQGLPFLGRRRVLKQSVFDRPRSHEPRFGLNPRVAGRDKWRRIEALQRRHGFLEAYRAARQALKARLGTHVSFPAGTWLLRRELGVPCASPS